MMETNKIYCEDCLDLMQRIDSSVIDLIYIDPPFGTNKIDKIFRLNWKKAWTEEKQHYINEFFFPTLKDKETISYLWFMVPRLKEMYRVLSEQGSIYVHIDWHVGHYVKVIMDDIFGKDTFQREIVWDMSVLSGYKSITNNWIRGHDIIFYYTKTNSFIFNKQITEHREEYLKRFNKIDEKGRQYFDGRGEKRYLDDVKEKGKPVGDVWNDIRSFQQIPTSKERVNYDTQKPESLLERIIKASSNKDSIVVDFFAGSGTTGAVAENLGRKWIMCDISEEACQIAYKRLNPIQTRLK